MRDVVWGGLDDCVQTRWGEDDGVAAKSKWELAWPRWLASFMVVVVGVVGTDCQTRVCHAEQV